ncbi:MAG: hypothetical protein N4A36_00420 [Candidatus Gracilibacteria bacterium]|jgi:hypothetical protein|nr:hypothetical protein [Candidatus Gracilibacteria bacterium]
MQFSYIALSPEYQRLTGVITAEDQAKARAKLHEMGLTVISITEHKGGNIEEEHGIKAPTTNTESTTFYFKVINPKGQTVDGTIDSNNRITAFRRLVGEYNFKILLLCEASVPPSERETEGTNGLKELAQEVEEEYGIKYQEPSMDTGESEESKKKDEYFEKQKKEVLKEVEEVVKQAEKILAEYSEKLSGEENQNIRNKLNDLMRIRLSNNLPHIRNLTEELFVLIEGILNSHSDIDESIERSDKGDLDNLLVTSEEDEFKNKASAFKGAIVNIRSISKKMKRMTKGTTTRRIKSKKEMEKVVLGANIKKTKKSILFPFVKEAIAQAKGLIGSKSSIRRKAHKEKLLELIDNFRADWKSRIAQQELENISKQDQEIIKEIENKDKPQTLFFYEIRLFIGWLLSFYILYFFFAFYIKFKWGETSPLFGFINNSLETPFLYAFSGILFFSFMALSIKIRFAQKNTTKSIIIFVTSFLFLILYLFNL